MFWQSALSALDPWQEEQVPDIHGEGDITSKRNSTAVVQQLNVRTEWMYPVSVKIQPFVGFDYFSSFMLNDLPLLYNSGTSSNFLNTYSQFRAGLRIFF